MIDLGRIVSRLRRKEDMAVEFGAFKSVFGTEPARKWVLPKLLQYSGILNPAPVSDSLFEQGRAAGRREFMLFIQYHLNLETKDIFDMVKSNPVEVNNGR